MMTMIRIRSLEIKKRARIAMDGYNVEITTEITLPPGQSTRLDIVRDPTCLHPAWASERGILLAARTNNGFRSLGTLP
jgi:hypothetical protein